jgi:hypothetical protein
VEREGSIPELPPELVAVQIADASLGRDGNGTPLGTEIDRFFARYGITEVDEQEIWEAAFALMAGERSAAAAERMTKEPDKD